MQTTSDEDLIPEPDVIRPRLAKVTAEADRLRKLLRLSLERGEDRQEQEKEARRAK
jgi:hypothetical protein